MTNEPSNTKFYSQIVELLQYAKNEVVRTVNQMKVITYFEIGKMVVEEEQEGKERADYGNIERTVKSTYPGIWKRLFC